MLSNVAEHVRNVYSVVRAKNPHANARPYIADSWIRCSNDYHLDPAVKRDPATVKRDELDTRRNKLEDLMQVAKIEMVNLYQQLAGSGYAIMLTDRDGVMLDLFGDPSFTAPARSAGLIPGAIWSERFQGTNGMGTCLVERTPIYVHHAEHFFASNIGLTCSASPIFDHEGNLVAVLDASGISRLAQQHTLALVNMSAQMIENRTFIRRLQDKHLVRFHSRPEFVGTLSEGVVAFDVGGRVLAANRHASFQLGFQRSQDLVGKPIAELFNVSLPALCETSTKKSFHPTPIFEAKRGSRFFAVAQRPANHNGRTAFVAGGVSHSRRQANRLAGGAGSLLDEMDTGDSVMAKVIADARRAIQRDVAVLLQGETGVGKSMLARAMALTGPRGDKPFVIVDCSGLSSQNIEAGLFGTDSAGGKLGQAHGGTLFLDEVADLSLSAQGRLLRLLDEGESACVALGRPSGQTDTSTPTRIDFRLICSSRMNLAQRVERGLMREDFFYRISGVTLELPVLRKRSDIRTLTEVLLKDLLSADESVDIDDALLQAIVRHSWPGNIRQLRNSLRAMLALRDDDRLGLADAPSDLRQESAHGNHGEDAGQTETGEPLSLNPLDAAERKALLHELEQHHWGISKVARVLGMSRNTLYRKMERLNLKDPTKGG